MLILTRRKNEVIRLGEDTRIVLVQVKGGQVRIGIECPSHVKVMREEVCQVQIEKEPCQTGSLTSCKMVSVARASS